MKIILSSAVLASVFSPAFSFSYLESLGGAAPVAYSPPPAAPAPVAPVAPAPVAPAAPVAAAPVVTGDAPAIGDYMDSLFSASSATSGPGLHSYKDSLPANTAVSGAGIPSYTGNIPPVNIAVGGAGFLSHTDSLSGGAVPSGKSFSPFGSKKSPASSSSGTTSGDKSFDITFPASSLVGLSREGTITLSGSIDSVTFN